MRTRSDTQPTGQHQLGFDDTLGVLHGWLGLKVEVASFSPSDYAATSIMTGRLWRARELQAPPTRRGAEHGQERLLLDLTKRPGRGFVLDRATFTRAHVLANPDSDTLIVIHDQYGVAITTRHPATGEPRTA